MHHEATVTAPSVLTVVSKVLLSQQRFRFVVRHKISSVPPAGKDRVCGGVAGAENVLPHVTVDAIGADESVDVLLATVLEVKDDASALSGLFDLDKLLVCMHDFSRDRIQQLAEQRRSMDDLAGILIW